ncbi:MAG: putative holin-like toxin [Defluviitaleaceae bacterium]|nr:putative holin-like toxin [Defluviitaleaceae bacterium]
MSVFESLMIMMTFGLLIIALILELVNRTINPLVRDITSSDLRIVR